MNPYQLHESTVIVTGGSSGIGYACVELLLEAGARVAFCGRNEDRLRSAEARLRERFPEARLLAQVCDVLDASSVQAFAAASQAALGPAQVLVNNAGQGRVSTFASTTDEAWNDELQLKFFSVIHPVRAFMTQLQGQANASIVCVNSLLASQPEPHMVATSAARAGLKNLCARWPSNSPSTASGSTASSSAWSSPDNGGAVSRPAKNASWTGRNGPRS